MAWNPTRATNNPTVESFESGNLDAWTDDTDQFTIEDESNLSFDAIDGSNVVQSTEDNAQIYSDSGLDNYPSKGTVSEVYFRYDSAVEVRAYFGYDRSVDEGYMTAMDATADSLLLFRYDNGSAAFLESVNVYTSADTWYKIVITWDDGTLGGSDNDITVGVEEASGSALDSLSVNDGTYPNQTGVGLRQDENTGPVLTIDNWQITRS